MPLIALPGIAVRRIIVAKSGNRGVDLCMER